MESAVKESSWVIKFKHNLGIIMDTSTETQQWVRRSIYKLPACVMELNENAYKPKAVSFGPYHYGEAHLMPMEEHKRRALVHFLKRSNKSVEVFVESLSDVVQQLRDSYHPLDPEWRDDEKFLQLMLLDGCFMLEIFRTAAANDGDKVDGYASTDPIFSKHGKLNIMPYVRRDMLMLENQLPMLVLDKLITLESSTDPKDEEYVNKLIQKFWSPGTPASNMGKCLHVLDVVRKSHIEQEPSIVTRTKKKHKDANDQIIRSATELDEAGVDFKISPTQSLRDISFKKGTLHLPVIMVDDATESKLLNMMAFERLHVGAGNEVTSYVFFMDNIIDSESDIALLHNKGIIQNAIGSDKAAADLFNSLSKDTTLDEDGKLGNVHRKVNHYCAKSMHRWRANLCHNYFTNPWVTVSVIAAILLFALTILQTVYTLYPYYHPLPDDAPPPSPPHHAPVLIPSRLPHHH